jgi:hypothetical protein
MLVVSQDRRTKNKSVAIGAPSNRRNRRYSPGVDWPNSERFHERRGGFALPARGPLDERLDSFVFYFFRTIGQTRAHSSSITLNKFEQGGCYEDHSPIGLLSKTLEVVLGARHVERTATITNGHGRGNNYYFTSRVLSPFCYEQHSADSRHVRPLRTAMEKGVRTDDLWHNSIRVGTTFCHSQ